MRPKGPLAIVPPPCADIAVTVYFERDSVDVSREAAAILKAAAEGAKGCAVRGVELTGLADAVGESAVNLAISRKRAEAVRQALSREGVRSTQFRLLAAGDAGAVAQGAALPLRRRVDVVIRLAPAA